MKIPLFLLTCIFALSTNAFADVVKSSGNWSSASTWENATVPTASSSTPMESLAFSTAGLELIVDDNYYVKTLSLASIAPQTISINANKTLYFKSNNIENSEIFSGSSNGAMIFNGAGTVSIAPTKNVNINGGIYEFNTKLLSTGASLYLKGGTFNVNNTWVASSGIQLTGAFNLNVNSNITFNGGLNGWSNSAYVKVAQGVTMNGSYLAFTKSDIYGTVHALSQHSTERYSVSIGRAPENSSQYLKAVIHSTGIVKADSSSQYLQIRASDLTVNSVANSISSNCGILLHQAKITLNTSGAFSVKGQEQVDSIITLGVIQKEADKATKTSATINFNADNNFGGFCLMGGSTLDLYTNGKIINIGKFYGEITSNDSGVDPLSYLVNLYNHIDNTTKVFDIDAQNIASYTDEFGALRSGNIKIDGVDVFLVLDEVNGGYWLNSSAIPEASTTVALFATIALALAVYRRKK